MGRDVKEGADGLKVPSLHLLWEMRRSTRDLRLRFRSC